VDFGKQTGAYHVSSSSRSSMPLVPAVVNLGLHKTDRSATIYAIRNETHLTVLRSRTTM
jgi:hypothetical protein